MGATALGDDEDLWQASPDSLVTETANYVPEANILRRAGAPRLRGRGWIRLDLSTTGADTPLALMEDRSICGLGTGV